MAHKRLYTPEEKKIIRRLVKQGKQPAAISEELRQKGFERSPRAISSYLYDQKVREKIESLPPFVVDENLKEYILTKLETAGNKMQIAREVKKVFKIEASLEIIKGVIEGLAGQEKIELNSRPVKRLFWDIETSFFIGWFWQPSFKARIGPHQILQDKKIICICYKWQHEDRVRTLSWDKNQDDKTMLEKFVKVLNEADEIVAHNGDRFDEKVFRTRCIKQNVTIHPKYRSFDTLKKARRFFSFPSNKLDELGKFLGIGRKMETGGIDLWIDIIVNKKPAALKKMVKYCSQDVILLEDVFTRLNPYVDHNTNHAVQRRLDKYCCPNCASVDVMLSHTDTTPMGYIKRHMECQKCKKFYHVSNKTYLRWIGSLEKDPDDLK